MIKEIKFNKRLMKQALSSNWQNCYDLAEQACKQANYQQAETLLNACTTKTPSLSFSIEAVIVLTRGAYLFFEIGRFQDAEKLFNSQKEHCKNLINDIEHPLVAEHINKRQIKELQALIGQNLNGLALVNQTQGKYEKAEKLFLEALKLQREILPLDHPDIAQTLNNLGYMYAYDLERFQEAEKLHTQALEIRRNAFGETHLAVAESLHNLAMVYGYHQAEYKMAESLYEQSIQIKEQYLSKNHPSIAVTQTFLGYLYLETSEYKKARKLLNSAIRALKKTLGEQHLNLAETATCLGILNLNQSKYEEAEELFVQANKIYQTVLGMEHWYTAMSLENLGLVACYQGKEEAQGYFNKSLEIYKKVLKPKDTRLATLMNNQALIFFDSKNYEEAKRLFTEAIEVYQEIHLVGQPKITSVSHPDMAKMMGNLARAYWYTGEKEKAKPLFEQAIEIIEKLFPETHPELKDLKEEYGRFLRGLEY